MEENFEKIRDDILSALLPDVPFDGWGWAVICKNAAVAGYDRATLEKAFPKKLYDVLDHYADWVDRQMLISLKDTNPESLRIRDRIRAAVLARLEILKPHKEAEKLAVSYWSMPPRCLKASKIAWRTADRIWNWAGDTTQDYNHYTKRTLLMGIMGPTLLVWFNDNERNQEKTAAFLDRRIENVMQLGQFFGKIKRVA